MPIDITDQPRRMQYVGSGTGPYNFPFQILEDTDIAVYQDDTLLTLNTHYTVTINVDGTGYIITTSSMTGSTVTIAGARPYQRLTDFTTGGDFTADAVNDELDSIHILLQQLLEETDRSLQLSPSSTASAALPSPSSNLLLGWNAGATALENKVPADLSLSTVTAYAATLLDDATSDAARQTLGVKYVAHKNMIIGGDFDANPWQRGTTFTSPATNTVTADRWKWLNTSAGVVTIFNTGDAIGDGAYPQQRCLHVDVTTADASVAAGDYAAIVQHIEGTIFRAAEWNGAGSALRSITLSFYVKSTLTGTHCVAFRNSVVNRSYIAHYTVNTPDTWEYKTITVPADSVGSFLTTTGIGITVAFTLMAGSTYRTTAGAWQAGDFYGSSSIVNDLNSTANNFKIALVQLELGSVATNFEERTAMEELALCQRYFEKSFPQATAPAQNAGTTNAYVASAGRTGANGNYGVIEYAVEKRATPGTFTFYNPSAANAQMRDLGAAADCSATGLSGLSTSGTRYCHWTATGNAGTVAGFPLAVHWTADSEL